MRKKSNVRREFFLYAANCPSQKTVERLGKETIDRLRRVLLAETSKPDLPRTEAVQDSGDLDYFFEMASSYSVTIHKVYQNGKLIRYEEIEEPLVTGLLPDSRDDLRFELARSICKFINDKKRLPNLRQCLNPHCRGFFIARDKKAEYCYKKSCRNKYHADDMRFRRKKQARLKGRTKTA